MRAKGSEHVCAEHAITVTFEGRPIRARRGETIAAALTAAGVLGLRRTRTGGERGIFCGMGVCQDCRVIVDGRHGLRACMTPITAPVAIERQGALAPAQSHSTPPSRPRSLPHEQPHVLVIGAGAAGLAAATVAARAGLEVMLVDDRPAAGGQFYKQLLTSPDLPSEQYADRQMRRGRDRVLRAREAGVRLVSGTEVVAAFQPMTLLLASPEGERCVRPQKLIVATGAYERGLHVPGWTLPGVMTTGALQTLLRSYRVLPGRRILIAGNGPLNLQVAREAARAGAQIVAVAELSAMHDPTRLATLARMTASAPLLTAKGAAIRAELALRRVPVLTGTRPSRIEPVDHGLAVTFDRPASGKPLVLDADIVAMSYGFEPRNELLRLLGCRLTWEARWNMLVPLRDAGCMTSREGLYAVGDCAGFGGAHIAEIEGAMAGLAAARSLGRAPADRTAAQLFSRLERHRVFQRALWQLFAPVAPATTTPSADTLVCRCEEVTYADLTAAIDDGIGAIGNLKRRTRVGMGPCQGRYCAAAGRAAMSASAPQSTGEESHWAARPPIRPIAIADLIAGLDASGGAP